MGVEETSLSFDAVRTEGTLVAGRDLRGRTIWFALLLGLTLAVFWAPLIALIRFAFHRDHYSHIILIPFISAWLMILDRDRIFTRLQTSWREGFGLLATGALIYALGQRYSTVSDNDRLSIAMFSVVLIWIACFVLCYGTETFRAGLFSVLFLFLMVPFPDFFLNRVIFWLQTASAEVSYVVFEALGIPVLRRGFVFALPGVTIVVSEECSGIRSSLIMTIISLVAGHLYLQTAWRKVVLTVVTLPMLIVKNGIRIVTLTLLSVYVDPSFLTGNLHQRGGVVFFVIALAMLAPILWFLKKSEPVPQGEL